MAVTAQNQSPQERGRVEGTQRSEETVSIRSSRDSAEAQGEQGGDRRPRPPPPTDILLCLKLARASGKLARGESRASRSACSSVEELGKALGGLQAHSGLLSPGRGSLEETQAGELQITAWNL